MKSFSALLFLPFFTLLSHLSPAQDIESFVKQNTVGIKSISPDSADYADLEAFGKAIGDARVVFLGEQDHGDAPAFLAKTRLVRYLHEKMGFNVLAFESDFFGLNAGWDRVDKNNTYPFLQANIFPIWPYCDACRYLFKNYIPESQQSEHPLQISGFDNQMVLGYSNGWLSKKLDSVLRANDLPVTHDPAYSTQILPLVDSCKKYELKNSSQYAPQKEYLLRIKAELATRLQATDFWMMVVDNLLSENSQNSLEKVNTKHMNIRDGQMARNLYWLATVKYPSQKIIVWAHNAHISKYSGHFNDSYYDGISYMGSQFDDMKGPVKTYVVGFDSYEGEAGRIVVPKTFTVQKPKKNSFESWVPDSLEYAFTDLSDFRNRYPAADVTFRLKGLMHDYLHNPSEWHKVFDGIFFIRKMYPCARLSKQY